MWTWASCRRCLILVVLLVGGGRSRGDEFQWRPAVSARLLEAGKYELFVYNENWFVARDGLEYAQFQLATRLRYHAHTNLALGLNYTYLDSLKYQPDHAGVWQGQHRLEFEVTPHWKHHSGLRLSNRNRLEVRWIEDRPDENYRSRHQLEAGWPIALPRPLTGVFSNAEVFYDWTLGRVTEWRVSPAGVNLRLSARTSLRLFYTWRETESSASWTTSHVVWTVLNLTLD